VSGILWFVLGLLAGLAAGGLGMIATWPHIMARMTGDQLDRLADKVTGYRYGKTD